MPATRDDLGMHLSASTPRALLGMLATTLLLVAAPASADRSARLVLIGHRTRTVTYPSRAAAEKRAPIVYLHGICGSPDRGCDAFAADATRFGPFVCPEANSVCGSSHSWAGTAFAKLDSVDRAMELVAERTRGALDVGRAGLLVGFSQGAYAAQELVVARPGRFRALLLVGAEVKGDPKRFARAGVTRMVLAAGLYDGTHEQMRRAAPGFAGSGVEARFVDLGAVGHTYEPSAERAVALREAWEWLDAADEVAD